MTRRLIQDRATLNSAATLLAVSGLVVWRLVWLASGPDLDTAMADQWRRQALAIAADVRRDQLNSSIPADQIELNVFTDDFDSLDVTVERFDPEAAVWIVAGQDGAPGYRGWDDDRDGVVDNASELGAAWSDDYCVTALPTTLDFNQPRRVVFRGAYVPVTSNKLSELVSAQQTNPQIRLLFGAR
ncbi:MAG: hypothetical protein AAF539_10740 [Planctomycetota bacterium]